MNEVEFHSSWYEMCFNGKYKFFLVSFFSKKLYSRYWKTLGGLQYFIMYPFRCRFSADGRFSEKKPNPLSRHQGTVTTLTSFLHLEFFEIFISCFHLLNSIFQVNAIVPTWNHYMASHLCTTANYLLFHADLLNMGPLEILKVRRLIVYRVGTILQLNETNKSDTQEYDTETLFEYVYYNNDDFKTMLDDSKKHRFYKSAKIALDQLHDLMQTDPLYSLKNVDFDHNNVLPYK